MNESADQQHPQSAARLRSASAPVTGSGSGSTCGSASGSVSPAYAADRLARALHTARTHADPSVRDRAGNRVRQWRAVLAGIADGSLSIGSRTPVAGLPVWATPKVVRGGFATGEAAADGPLGADETAWARRAGVPAERAALFAHFLEEEGLAELWALLDSGRYALLRPEEAVLLTVAWLVRAEDYAAAAALVAEVRPLAGRLRFLPRVTDRPAVDADRVHRGSVGAAAGALRARGPRDAVETQREALAVWRPFDDVLLTYWLVRRSDPDGADPCTRTAGPSPGAAGRTEEAGGRTAGAAIEAGCAEAAVLLERYRELAAVHTRCGKHRDPKSNTGIMLRALTEAAAGRQLTARLAGLLRHAVDSVVARRGLPGSPDHVRLRTAQARQAALPPHHEIAAVLADRLDPLDPRDGLSDPAALLLPVTAEEAARTGLPAGTPVPSRLGAPVRSALSAPVEELVAAGLVPSAEVLAELVPQLVANASALRYEDPALRTLTAGTYRAFRNRRSLLLVDLARQVRVEELPWVRAVSGHGGEDDAAATARAAAGDTLRRVGSLALGTFPGTLLPNPLVSQLAHLARQAELGVPLVEELAADIFTGRFSGGFVAAAGIAAELVEGGPYARYFGIDCAAVREIASAHEAARAGGPGTGPRSSAAFDRLCAERAGSRSSRSWSAAVNSTVVEQAQILTTHNLAVLAGPAGVVPPAGWDVLAESAFGSVCRLVGRIEGAPWALRTVKDAAYAWRQALFHLSMCPPARQAELVAAFAERAAWQPWHAAARLAPVVAGLRLVAGGGSFGPDGTALGGMARRFEGWTADRHWMLPRATRHG